MEVEHVFQALADNHRRHLMDLLAKEDGQSLSELCAHFSMTRFGVMKHLNILEEAGLISTRKVGREKRHYVNPAPMQGVVLWVDQYRRMLDERFDRLEEYLRELQKETKMIEEETTTAGTGTLKEATVTRVFDAPRELVFKAWTDPKHLAQWWGPHHFTNPVCEFDARPGGSILIHMAGPDGVVFPMSGTVEEIVAPERLVFTGRAFQVDDGTYLLEDRIIAMFEEQDGKTKVTVHAALTKVAQGAEGAASGMEEGWNQSLERLDTYLKQA